MKHAAAVVAVLLAAVLAAPASGLPVRPLPAYTARRVATGRFALRARPGHYRLALSSGGETTHSRLIVRQPD